MKDDKGRDLLESHQNPACPHCALADALNEWRLGQGGASFLERQYVQPQAEGHSDAILLRAGIMRALGLIMMELLAETPDYQDKAFLADQFNATAEEAAEVNLERYNPRNRGTR